MRKLLSAALVIALAACQSAPRAPGFSPRQIAALKQAGFEQRDNQWELSLADRLLFATDESDLEPTQRARIRQLTAALLAVGIRGATVEGNTDSTGTAGYNLQLSEQRAQVVKQAMAHGGMAPDAIKALGLGETHPVDTNRSAGGRKENRRVVIVVTAADAL